VAAKFNNLGKMSNFLTGDELRKGRFRFKSNKKERTPAGRIFCPKIWRFFPCGRSSEKEFQFPIFNGKLNAGLCWIELNACHIELYFFLR
jgi:hypothetical protein